MRAISRSSRPIASRLPRGSSFAPPLLTQARTTPLPVRRRVYTRTLATASGSITSSHTSQTASLLDTESDTSVKPHFRKILIANRGEIACRIIRSARKLGVKTVAVYSEADKDCIHVKMADEAYCIGPAPSTESYLNIDKILAVAKATGAQAIHPGYGFLSESSVFAERIKDAGLIFIGPPTSAIKSMGSKRESKEIMTAAGVPCVPGYHGSDQSLSALLKGAEQTGYPLLIKPTHGGGGKGMRIVRDPKAFQDELESAKREAIKSFSNDEVLLERWLEKPRHVEVQVFADTLGGCVALWERDCSVQRRHQKIIEEAPAPGLSAELKKDLAEKAVAAAKAVDYVGAGTVEFIMDAETGEYFFMEMNTRLQVEHPVTEMVTGVDLVEWQLSIAAGNPLPLTQDQIPCMGHAFEARIYAERPESNFLPDAGKLLHTKAPVNVPHRLETGFWEGDEISSYYDPMISKLIVHGPDRSSALSLLRTGLDEYQVVGPSTNIEFLKQVAGHEVFAAGPVETSFVPTYQADLFPPRQIPDEILAQAALYLTLRSENAHKALGTGPWSQLVNRRFGDISKRSYKIDDHTVEIYPRESGSGSGSGYAVKINENEQEISIGHTELSQDGIEIISTINDNHLKSTIVPVHSKQEEKLHIFNNSSHYILSHQPSILEDPSASSSSSTQSASGGGMVSPMPATVIDIRVSPGEKVVENQVLVVLESMKMEISIRANKDGVVKDIRVTKGKVVEEGEVLVDLE
ncbi:acetyl-CoA carboxylase, biotin carboxylase subunit [Kwoniella dejecticola CBS 10117]|uniref:Acetyl-CoA carboxylase, biotin carboxylase subunit n=1 Tax=Kwoniella dejecticola CBS 10117 TaxID=1296121 RepID=A0A1A5ZVR4_9TREE|nr:acetyl-CoA carboxylase, biotin carboxylase subunit [Kwoniella dejecticola CBS 10117]OBR81897.1 acetyl-CoA carboxylase, biotin carboxylase subunit [Kwoniella dejecticola CBS 10117]